MTRYFKKLFNLLPRYNKLLYKIAVYYVDRYNNYNNCDFHTNGEAWFLRSLLSNFKKGVLFDVGVNIGNYSRYAYEFCPQVLIHMFEPCEETFKQLSSQNWPANFRLNNIAL